MGKIRVKTLGDEELEKEQKAEVKKRKQAKLNEAKSAPGGKAEIKLEETSAVKPVIEEKIEEVKKPAPTQEPKEKNKKQENRQKEFHSQKYQAIAQKVDKNKNYNLNEALALLEELQRGKFDETVELHINTVTTGISGNVTLPYGTGKKTVVAVADDKLIAEIEKGTINFDILVAEPSVMPKLAKVAKILGPRGLMPNPKNGTISSNPEDLVKKYEGGQISFKTEKAPIIHLTVGKLSFGPKKLEENIDTMIKAVKKANIMNVTLKSTMSPGIKIQI